MTTYISNSFSLGMIPSGGLLSVVPITKDDFCSAITDGKSIIGHPATAQVLTTMCGKEVKVNRQAVTLQKGDIVVVAQVLTRLDEGKVLSAEEVKQLVEQGKLTFMKVTLL
ncbi:MAG: DUF1874 domain-containing protein [Metallosphaera sp.]|uniref:STIV orfB116 family protein n=1 Tax=Metallosphaera sp. TaxID=2020860 RepID=UPI003178520F